ncbi:dual specificity phosphatase [Plectosphaerella cucumerina]|uniref:Dual specificity phosphatase n=1 Tax=Plectosphaerella cucumerina TaxID=40658 RepID=A0A8K0THU8_9PEZI|nr:dual specificity phosphatase [Plectosphaerella cucumerina]
MATIALTRPAPPHRPASALGAISLDSAPSSQAAIIPNKHIPICPAGPAPSSDPPAPSSNSSNDEGALDNHNACQSSLLYPPPTLPRLESGPLKIYKIDAKELAAAVDHTSRQPLPDPATVFPWLHGLHPHNHIQQAFFTARRRTLRRTPTCIRGLTLVKADGDLAISRLKGAIASHEFLDNSSSPSEFIDPDPRDGFCVRNFQIQTAKWAMVSDIVIYGDNMSVVRKLAWDVASAQSIWREKHEAQGLMLPEYNTFICVGPFSVFEQDSPEIVAVDSTGRLTGSTVDFFYQERLEMYAMTRATEISHNVWLGPTPDAALDDDACYDILIECSDVGRLKPSILRDIALSEEEPTTCPFVDFPSSGSLSPMTWSQPEADDILDTCRWIYHLAHGTIPEDEGACIDKEPDAPGKAVRRPRKVLIHCADGYTESTMLGIAYFSYSTGRGVPEAWLRLHTDMKRNFFAYPSDVALLTCLEPRLLRQSPVHAGKRSIEITSLIDEPAWLPGLDGSFPSRILDYMYLGNLGHANNPDLLKAMGIGQILSVGETSMWRDGELEDWGTDNVCLVQGVQDNGIDPLTDEFERCLRFIDRGRQRNTATLVHCRVGVSRSATICIAEVMRALDLSVPRAYCFVRARRLNVIIQPHLLFAYELLKWEELLQQSRRGHGELKRELEWPDITREIALMNRPYAR